MKKQDWKKAVIKESDSIFDAIKVLDKGHLQIGMITNGENCLLGVVTDGDIRRSILKRIPLETQITQIMIKDPTITFEDASGEEIVSLMKKTHYYQIPILDKNKKLVGLKCIDEYFNSEKKDNLVVLMAGGLGERMLPHTKSLPKPLLDIGGKPIIFDLLDNFINAGFNNIIISTNYMGKMIKEKVQENENYRDKVRFINENKRLGTAGSLQNLPEKPEKCFFLVNADLLTRVSYKAMLQFHEVEENTLTLGVKEKSHKISYGVVETVGARVVEVVEKPVNNFFINVGIYVIGPDALNFIPKDKYYDATNLINDLIKSGKRVGSFPVHEYWLDVGNPKELIRANIDYSNNI